LFCIFYVAKMRASKNRSAAFSHFAFKRSLKSDKTIKTGNYLNLLKETPQATRKFFTLQAGVSRENTKFSPALS